jgi:hypothetical protein
LANHAQNGLFMGLCDHLQLEYPNRMRGIFRFIGWFRRQVMTEGGRPLFSDLFAVGQSPESRARNDAEAEEENQVGPG